MFIRAEKNVRSPRYIVKDPPFAQKLYGDVRFAWIWVLVRLYIGYVWLEAGWNKVNNPAWVGPEAGRALSGFINNALTLTTGEHPEVQAWYATFLRSIILPNADIWSNIVAYGELLVGLALIVGIFTGIAAFFGLFMNVNYLLAGTVSTNPILLLLSILLILAWKTAGWWGLDRWALVDLGTPWSPGLAFQEKPEEREKYRRAEM
jgi:thiosulfate dehydrogenase (quinone) large subunit